MKRQDLSGKRFGLLVAVRYAGRRGKNSAWLCQCDCGGETIATTGNLNSGISTSCGCRRRATCAALCRKRRTHGRSKTTEYHVWTRMMQRCYQKDYPSYESYGGRGIRVCRRWHTFVSFLADMGQKPSPQLSLDRIDNNGNYTPANCRWATPAQQTNNRRVTIMLDLNGQRKSLSEWASFTGLSRHLIWDRIRSGWDTNRALTTPVRGRNV